MEGRVDLSFTNPTRQPFITIRTFALGIKKSFISETGETSCTSQFCTELYQEDCPSCARFTQPKSINCEITVCAVGGAMITATAPRKRISCTLFESRVHFCAAEESEEGKLPEKKNRPTTREGHSNLHVKCLPSLPPSIVSFFPSSSRVRQLNKHLEWAQTQEERRISPKRKDFALRDLKIELPNSPLSPPSILLTNRASSWTLAAVHSLQSAILSDERTHARATNERPFVLPDLS